MEKNISEFQEETKKKEKSLEYYINRLGVVCKINIAGLFFLCIVCVKWSLNFLSNNNYGITVKVEGIGGIGVIFLIFLIILAFITWHISAILTAIMFDFCYLHKKYSIKTKKVYLLISVILDIVVVGYIIFRLIQAIVNLKFLISVYLTACILCYLITLIVFKIIYYYKINIRLKSK